MNEPSFLAPAEPPNRVGDWAVRLAVALAYLSFGFEKFPSGADAHWVQFFREVGMGDWFRYFTGGVEVLGALLVLIPRTALAGLCMLAVTMAGAVIIVAFVLHHPGQSVFPGAFLVALAGVAFWHSQNR
jgi:uncharacterized membrane protein YphA (DoxX/SURF4 family)